MARRWRRGDKEDAETAARPRPPADEPEADDLESRLGAVSSRFDRPPTAEELRAAFGRRPNADRDPDPEPTAGDFASRFPTETLFGATPVGDDPVVEEPSSAEDRSRTTGDYYYDPEDAWEVLGLAPGSSWKQIATAHRRLAMQHHPDRLLDATAEERQASEERMREVNVAYSVLRRLTGH